MLSYTGQRNLFGTLVNNSDSAILTTADTLINDRRRFILSRRNWWFLEKAFTFNTVASQQFYTLQGDIDRILTSPYVTIGNIRYVPRECTNREEWDRLNLVSYTSDIPTWWIQYGSTVGIFPKPTTANYVYTLNAKQKVIDLSIADYTTGSIVSVATGGTAVVGTGTTWTAGMVGQWLKITAGAAANLGDGVWYQIAAVPSTTTITLAQPYGGVAISTATSPYTIGQMSIMPDAYDSLPIYLALQTYFTSIEPDQAKATMYTAMAGDLAKQMDADQSNRTGGRVLDEGIDKTAIVNPNLTVGF